LATLSFLKLVKKLTKNCGSEFGGLLWRHLTPQRKTAIYRCTTTVPQVHKGPQRYFAKFTSGAQTCSLRAVFGLPVRSLSIAISAI